MRGCWGQELDFCSSVGFEPDQASERWFGREAEQKSCMQDTARLQSWQVAVWMGLERRLGTLRNSSRTMHRTRPSAGGWVVERHRRPHSRSPRCGRHGGGRGPGRFGDAGLLAMHVGQAVGRRRPSPCRTVRSQRLSFGWGRIAGGDLSDGDDDDGDGRRTGGAILAQRVVDITRDAWRMWLARYIPIPSRRLAAHH